MILYIYITQVLLYTHCIYNMIAMTMYPCLVVSHSPAFVDQASSDSLIEENEETPREAEVQAVARRKLGVILQCHCRVKRGCKIPYKQWEKS